MFRALILTACLFATSAFSETSILNIGQDHFEAGETARFSGPEIGNIFMAGNRVEVTAPVTKSAHLAGRRVTVEAAIAGDLFAAGYSVVVSGAVAGDASVTGYEVTLGEVGGSLRAAGTEVVLNKVGGYALVTAGDVTVQGAIAGDAVFVADQITFGPNASVAGALTIYAADPASITVPASVAPMSRVKIEPRSQYDESDWDDRMPMKVPFWRIVAGFLTGVLISGLIAALVIAVAPKAVQNWRELALAQPGRAIWSGFLVTSALAGSGFVLMLTIVGIILLPVMLIVTLVAIFAGYALGSYVLGVGLWLKVGRKMPEGLAGKFGLACLGALVAGLAWAIPVAGWFFVLGLTMLGIGTLAAFALPDGLLLRRAAVAL